MAQCRRFEVVGLEIHFDGTNRSCEVCGMREREANRAAFSALGLSHGKNRIVACYDGGRGRKRSFPLDMVGLRCSSNI